MLAPVSQQTVSTTRNSHETREMSGSATIHNGISQNVTGSKNKHPTAGRSHFSAAGNQASATFVQLGGFFSCFIVWFWRSMEKDQDGRNPWLIRSSKRWEISCSKRNCWLLLLMRTVGPGSPRTGSHISTCSQLLTERVKQNQVTHLFYSHSEMISFIS